MVLPTPELNFMKRTFVQLSTHCQELTIAPEAWRPQSLKDSARRAEVDVRQLHSAHQHDVFEVTVTNTENIVTTVRRPAMDFGYRVSLRGHRCKDKGFRRQKNPRPSFLSRETERNAVRVQMSDVLEVHFAAVRVSYQQGHIPCRSARITSSCARETN